MHGFLTRDDIAPSEFRAVALQELERYKNVELWNGEVTDVALIPITCFVSCSMPGGPNWRENY